MQEEEFLNGIVQQGCSLVHEVERVRFQQIRHSEKDVLMVRVEQYVVLLGYLYILLMPIAASNVLNIITKLIDDIIVFFRHGLEQTYTIDDVNDSFLCPFESRNLSRVGRPRYDITFEQLSGLRRVGFTWRGIASMLNVSEKTLRRRRQEFDMPSYRDEFTQLSNAQLDEVVADILKNSPNSGERMVIGSVQSRGLKISRERLRDSINRVDPISRALRRRTCIVRRNYNVKGPNCLWHMDGHHKLIRWRLVFHGCIDGFSRIITFLQCSNNNRAGTVFELFLRCLRTYKTPLRIRTDQGLENIEVARWMVQRHGVTKRPVLTGLSVHNQRIERLWRDLGTYVVSIYKSIFYFMEHNNLLDPIDEICIFALHYTFLPRINKSCSEFITQWNNHPLSSEHNRSPIQVWTEGLYRNWDMAADCVADVDSNENMDTYGIELDAPLPELDGGNIVEVPESRIDIPQSTLIELQNANIDPLWDDGNYGIDTYQKVVNILSNNQY